MKIVCCSFFIFFLITIPAIWASEWQEKLEQHFDIVETFDELDDWYGTEYAQYVSGGDIFAERYPDDFPKIDGKPSGWCYYSKWDTSLSPGEYWIKNFGSGTYFNTEGKAALIDLSNIKGPSRLGTYFGNGESTSGYRDIYVFYMVKVSRNQWPIRCEKNGHNVTCSAGGTGIYEDGKDYSFWGSWKFNTIGTGWNSCQKWNGSVPDHEYRYGDASITPHIRVNNYGPFPRLDGKPEQKQNLLLNGHINGSPQNEANLVYDKDEVHIDDIRESVITWTGKGVAVITDEWMGVEFHYTLEDPAGSGNGKMEAWIYNKEGQFRRSFYIEGINYLDASGQGRRFNRFFFGGNNSNAYLWGPTMEAPYYVDDLIIDDSRIGPKYFELIGGPITAKAPPQNLRIVKISEMSDEQKPLRLDFNHHNTLITYPGWTSFPVSSYTAARGYGWDSVASIGARDRGSGNELERDLHNLDTDKSFLADLRNGRYQITLYFGDADYDHLPVDVYAEGTIVLDDVAVQKGVFISKSFEIEVSDGQLDISLKVQANTVLNGLEIIPL